MELLRRTFATQAPCSTILIRLIVGGTFLSEGIPNLSSCISSAAGPVVPL